MSAIYMRRPATGDAAPPTAGGWTLIDQTDALVDDAEIAATAFVPRSAQRAGAAEWVANQRK